MNFKNVTKCCHRECDRRECLWYQIRNIITHKFKLNSHGRASKYFNLAFLTHDGREVRRKKILVHILQYFFVHILQILAPTTSEP